MARLILDEVARGKKVLVYCGAHHGFTRYRIGDPYAVIGPPTSPTCARACPSAASCGTIATSWSASCAATGSGPTSPTA